MLSHSFIPKPKGARVALTDSEKHRSFAISSLLSKLLDHIIIDHQVHSLGTSYYQFGFKSHSSTVVCTTMVNETIQYYYSVVVVVCPLQPSSSVSSGCPGPESSILVSSR